MKKERIDKLLIERRMADSPVKAQALVMSGVVLVDEQRVEKPSQEFAIDAKIRIKGESAESKFVSRGGLKLEKALDEFAIDVKDFVCLDIGASTGGFTDCLLQRGAELIVAVDVGHNQIDWRLRNDPRVKAREGVNARYLKPQDFDQKFDLIVMDVSFISVTKIFPVVAALLKDTGKIIVLIKPQFEVARGEVGQGGIVREAEKHKQVIIKVNEAATEYNLKCCGTIDSPILGADGNKEFLAFYERQVINE